MIVLVINCGSSSIKYQVFRMPAKEVMASGIVERIGAPGSSLTHKKLGEKHVVETEVSDHSVGMKLILDTLIDAKVGVISDMSEIRAVGHRVVQGGDFFDKSALIDDKVKQIIADLGDLAPLHNPAHICGINAAEEALPGVPQIAVFDTVFHQTMPEKAYTYAIPHELYEKYRIRRYGAHGTSHHYVALRAAELLGKPADKTNVITCHLGNGCSITAVKNGKCVDTSMGLTPLGGVCMGTRCGDIDPAVVFYLISKGGEYTPERVSALLNKESGLLGISGISNDMRNLLEECEKGNERAKLAVDIFIYHIQKFIGAYFVVLGRVDGIVFTGGIGENNAYIREGVSSCLAPLGILLDNEKNAVISHDERDVASANSRSSIFVIPTNEEGYIATEAYNLANA